jgi:hypothetical protein
MVVKISLLFFSNFQQTQYFSLLSLVRQPQQHQQQDKLIALSLLLKTKLISPK